MIPILFEHNETAFTSNGICRLPDAVSCTVCEVRNGVFEVALIYPITGLHYAEITEGRIIAVSHDEQKDIQPFEIYGRTAPINGLVTFYAHHISYRLSGIICQPVDGASVSAVFSEISAKSMSTNPFTFWTDNTTAGNLDIAEPRSVRAILGGQQGSILDVFGGEYEFDKFLVRNYAHRGQDNGVVIRYGKNLIDLTQDYSVMEAYNSIVPYWASMDGTVVYGGIVSQAGATEIIARAVDYSQDFPQTTPTVAQLEAKAAADLASKQPWTPSENIAIDFVALWQTEEYKYIAPLERVQLCDTVTVIYTALGVQATAKVIRVEWDALTERYSKIVLGDAKSSFAETIIKPVEKQLEQMPTTSMMQAAIDHATELITGGLGGHVVIKQNASGEPEEILIMDSDDMSTAVHVLRINVNGIGFSSSGINGPYTSAWTLDGQFVADFITAGTMLANRIQGGTLTLGGADNGNGTLVVKDANGNTIATINNAGVDIDKGVIDLGNGAFLVDNAGNLTANRANLTGKIRSEHEGFWMEIEDGELSAGYNTNSFGSLNLVQRLGGFGIELKSSTHDVMLWGDDVRVTRGRDNNQHGSVVITPESDSTRVRNIYITDISGGGKGLAVQDGNGTYYWAQLNAWS
ncbi:MAG: phage tail protein [Oscillospiraceae bacterium]|nr:phage tail protein [Oscillospiraceae bacterium]